MNEVYEIGNGQVCNTQINKVCGSLDCMHDQKALLIRGGYEHGHTDNRKSPERFTGQVESNGHISDFEQPNGNRGG